MFSAADLPPTHDYITTGGLVITTLLTVIGGVLIALIQSNRKLTRRGVNAAEVAAERSEPTGNGWSKKVTEALARIEREQTRQAQALRQQGRDIGGIREEIRIDRRVLVDHITESRRK